MPLEWFSILLVLKYGALLGIPQAAAIAGALAFVYYVVLDVVAGLSWLPVQVAASHYFNSGHLLGKLGCGS